MAKHSKIDKSEANAICRDCGFKYRISLQEVCPECDSKDIKIKRI